MSFWYPRRFFTHHAARTPRVILRVEELESRRVLSTVGQLPAETLLAAQQHFNTTTPALTAPTHSAPSTNINPGPFIINNGSSAPNPTFLAPQSSLGQTLGGFPLAAYTLLPANSFSQLPPILQGATVVPPSGSLTFADLQTITANFIIGGHTETSMTNQNARTSNPPNSPRTMPTPTPNPQDSVSVETPAAETFSTLETKLPSARDSADESKSITDSSEEFLQESDVDVVSPEQLFAEPVLVASLAAHWANHQRRPTKEENENTGKAKAFTAREIPLA